MIFTFSWLTPIDLLQVLFGMNVFFKVWFYTKYIRHYVCCKLEDTFFLNMISNLQNILQLLVFSLSDIKVYFGNLKKFYSTTSFFTMICFWPCYKSVTSSRHLDCLFCVLLCLPALDLHHLHFYSVKQTNSTCICYVFLKILYPSG